MGRQLHRPNDPEAVALAVLALRNYVNAVQNPHGFEQDTSVSLAGLGLDKQVAQRLVDHFDKLPSNTRKRYLGDLGVATRVPDKLVIAKRQIPRFPRAQVRISHEALRRPRIPGGPGGPGDQMDTAGNQVLAPTDYKVVYEGMYCVDETGWDLWGSDEIYIISSAVHIMPNGTNVVRTERLPITGGNSGVYGDVDSHEKRVGPRSAVWAANVANLDGGMSLTTVVMEHDEGDPNKYKDEVDSAVKVAIAIATYLFPLAGGILALVEASGLVTDFFNWLLGTGDDEVGTNTVVLDRDALEDYSRTPASDFREGSRAPTGIKYDFSIDVNDHDYYTFYTVERTPSVPDYPGPVIE